MQKMYVQKVIDYIEENIEEALTMDMIAGYISYSRFHLHKLFSIYTGMYVMEYVRKRKLAYSLQDLQTDMPIVDIAFKYGYKSGRAFSRAFQNVYGVSPGKYRNNTCELTVKLELSELGGIKMLPYLSETKVVNVSKIHALAHRVVSKECEHDVIAFMTAYQLKHNLVPLTELGFDVPVSEEDQEKGLRAYEYWLVLDEEAYTAHEPDADVAKITVDKGKYLMLTITEPFMNPWERIPNGWKKAWDEVEKNHTFRKDCPIYGFEEKVVTLEGVYMNIYVPIV